MRESKGKLQAKLTTGRNINRKKGALRLAIPRNVDDKEKKINASLIKRYNFGHGSSEVKAKIRKESK